jgi:hypothetical protein
MAANTNTVTLSTNLNVDPYYDDFDETKNYHRVLYRPGLAVQGRELTQTQSILQNQIDRFAESIYNEGSVIKGCDYKIESVSFVRLRDRSANTSLVVAANFEDLQVRGATSNVLAVVLDSADGSEAADPNYKTLFVKYIDTGGANTSGNVVFTSSEVINSTTGGYSANVISSGSSTGYGSRITFSEGIIFAKDHFVRVPEQSIVLSKYSRSGSYFVGYNVTESIVDYTSDDTLLDPANGSYNYTAPGANRLKLTATLTKYPITGNTSSNFVKLVEIRGGIPVKNTPKPDYSIVNETVARRHYDTSGSFIVQGMSIRLNEHLNQANNFGKYTAANGGVATKLVVDMEPGRAYVKGNEIETLASIPVNIAKATDTESLEQVNVTPNYGNYITVHEVAGVWDVNTHKTVSIRNQFSNTISNDTFSSDTSLAGVEIGTARVRAVEHVSGTKGSASARYKLYLYDINMTGGPFTTARSIHVDNSSDSQANAVADIITTSGVASISETDFNKALFPLPVSDVKTLRDTGGNVDTNFKFIKNFDVTIATDGTFSIATGSADERYTFSGVASDTIATTNFHVVLNGTAASSGTVDTGSINSGANTITGLTNADTKFNVGDKIVISSQTMTVSSVASTTINTIENASGTYTTQAITKKFYPGHVIDMAGVGGDGSDRQINATSQTSATFDIQETLGATVSATVVAELSKVDGREITKAYNSGRYVQITVNQSDGTANTTGPWNLGLSDVHKILSVRKNTGNTTFTTATEGVDVTSDFLLDDGQTDNMYKHGSLKLAPNKTASAGDVYLVKLNYFTHDTSQGIGYFSVDSYPIDDTNVANTTAISTQEIPLYRSKTTGLTYDLRNMIDIRPRIADTATNTTAVGSASVNPATSTTISTVANGLRYLAPNETLTADLDYYLPRRDVVSLSAKGALKVTSGASSIAPQYPEPPDDHLVLAKLDIAPYPSLSTRVAQQYNRFDQACTLSPARTERYTMADIGKIRDRLDRVEYFTRLSFLENEAANLKFAANTGIDRFKNGAIVDSFSGHNIGNVLNPDYKISIDKVRGEMRPPFSIANINLDYKPANSSNVYIGPPDARITVSGTDTFTVGETVTAGAASGNVIYQVGRRVYLQGVQGTFSSSSTATGADSSSTGTISSVYTPGTGKLISPKYAHKKVIEQKYASTSRNAAGLFWNFLAKVTLNPDHDFWVDTVHAPDLQVNFDHTNDNIAGGAASWTTDWGNWTDNTGAGASWSETSDPTDFRPQILSNTPVGGPDAPIGRIVNVQEVGQSVTNTFQRQTRSGIRTSLVPTTTTERLGPKVINTSIIPFMRSRVIQVEGRGFRPNARLYAFFDGVDVSSYITPTNSSWVATGSEGDNIVSDANGDLYCRFRIPNDNSIRFRTGTKRLRFSDNPTNAQGAGLVTTSGEATYAARGTTQTVQDTIVSTRHYQVVQETVYDYQTITSSTTNEVRGVVHTVGLQTNLVDQDNYVKVHDLTGNPDYQNYRNEWTIDEPREATDAEEEKYWEWVDEGFGDWQFSNCGDDPIAQTFTVGGFDQVTSTTGVYLTKIDLFFATKDTSRPVFVEIREVDGTTSLVTNRIIPFSAVTLEADDINTSTDSSAPTPVYFTTPVFLTSNKDYAICIRPGASNPNVSLFVSRLGGTDLITGDRINKQPYVGILFASSNDKVWQPVQDEDLKFNLYVANFAINQTGTAVFKNPSIDFMQITGSNTFDVIGEAIHGQTTITTINTGMSVNTDYVLVGNTSGANGLVVSQSSNTIVVKDVSTGSKFTAGERVNVVINGVKQEPHTTIHTSTYASGNVAYFDNINYANTRLHIDNVSGSFANGEQLKGQTSGKTTSITKLENIEIDVARLNTAILKFEQSSMSSSGRFNINEFSRDTQFRSLDMNSNISYKTPKYLLSKTLESNIGNTKSGEVKFTLSTSNPSIAPVIDIEKTNLTMINNRINNDVTNENNASGGNALARYITRTMTLEDGQDAEDLRVKLSAYKPIGTEIRVYYKILNKDDSDEFADRAWTLMEQTTVASVYSSEKNEYDFKTLNYEVPSANLSGSSNEIQYTNSQGVTYTGYKYLAIKIVLTSTTSGVVPKVTEMMAIALQA